MTIINLMPHPFTFTGDAPRTIPSSGIIRVAVQSHQVGDIDGIPVNANTFGDLTGDSIAPIDGSVFIVSRLVASHPSLAERQDIFVPDAFVRNSAGQIIGANGLTRV